MTFVMKIYLTLFIFCEVTIRKTNADQVLSKVDVGSNFECACEHNNKGSEQNAIVCKENGSFAASTSCAPDETCVKVNRVIITSNLTSAVMELCDKTYLVETYQKVNGSICEGWRRYNLYNSLNEAKRVCYHDTICIGVFDNECEHKKYKLCRKMFVTHPKLSSCIYKKREMKSLPSDFIWSTEGKTCSKLLHVRDAVGRSSFQ